MKHRTLIAACIVLTASSAAFAGKAWVRVGDDVIVAPFHLPADAVDEMNVVDAAGRKVGEVDEVIGPTANEATAVTVDFDEDSGLGDRGGNVIVPLSGVHLQGTQLRLTGDAKAIKGYEIYAAE